MSERYIRDIAYDYAEGTANVWEQKMRQEDADTMRDEEANPNIYRAEDGHAYVNTWYPGDMCDKCAAPEFRHTEERKS